jgi:hypothetical protein
MVEKSKNSLNKKLEELKEWEENQYNPGYYIGTGRVPKPVKGIKKRPLFLIFLSLFMILPLFGALFFKISAQDLIAFIFPTFLGGILFYAAIREIFEERKRKLKK